MGQFKVTEPMALGHETSATVIKLGPKVKRLNVGDRVALEPGIVCRVCPDCKRGEYQVSGLANQSVDYGGREQRTDRSR
jgi:D-xylulose reductase